MRRAKVKMYDLCGVSGTEGEKEVTITFHCFSGLSEHAMAVVEANDGTVFTIRADVIQFIDSPEESTRLELAGMAMQGWIEAITPLIISQSEFPDNEFMEQVTKEALRYADALIAKDKESKS